VKDRSAAQRAMLVYTRFDREPFPSLYELFAGKRTTAEFFADLTARKLTDNPRVMFFSHYYAGLHEELLGHRARAHELLHAAVANRWGQTAENGPAYMWQVARLHYEALAAK
jgi:lipoprotein NlpI